MNPEETYVNLIEMKKVNMVKPQTKVIVLRAFKLKFFISFYNSLSTVG